MPYLFYDFYLSGYDAGQSRAPKALTSGGEPDGTNDLNAFGRLAYYITRSEREKEENKDEVMVTLITIFIHILCAYNRDRLVIVEDALGLAQPSR